MPTRIWAHRGASAYAPENTLEAFEKAIRMGADGIELDVQMSSDGALVVIHDETVNRTSNGKGRVADMTRSALKALDFSYGKKGYVHTRIPTLEDVYALIKPTGLYVNVEIKCDRVIYAGICARVVKAERNMGMRGRVLYSSFNHYVLPLVREADPQASIGLLYSNGIANPWDYAKHMRVGAIHPPYRVALRYKNLMERCRQNNIAVHAWTADDPAAITKLTQLGVDAIITNKPDIARALTQNMPCVRA